MLQSEPATGISDSLSSYHSTFPAKLLAYILGFVLSYMWRRKCRCSQFVIADNSAVFTLLLKVDNLASPTGATISNKCQRREVQQHFRMYMQVVNSHVI